MKLKQCTICHKERPYWSAKLKCCKACYSRIQVNKPKIQSIPFYKIPTKSSKKITEDRLYKAKRILYLTTNKGCEAKLEVCTGQGSDIHHLYFGADRQKYYLDESTWKTVCRECHRMIHDVLSSEEQAMNNHLLMVKKMNYLIMNEVSQNCI